MNQELRRLADREDPHGYETFIKLVSALLPPYEIRERRTLRVDLDGRLYFKSRGGRRHYLVKRDRNRFLEKIGEEFNYHHDIQTRVV